MGLMPQGLEMSRKIGHITVERHIVEQFIRDSEQREWSEVTATPLRKNFDDQGVEITSTGPGAMISYVAEAQILDGVLLPKGRYTSSQSSEPRLRKIVVKVASSTDPSFAFNEANQARFATSVHLMAQSQGL